MSLRNTTYYYYYGPGSSVGIATDYGLDGPGIELLRMKAGRTPMGPTKIKEMSQENKGGE
jgi:hypothetical protein